MITVRFASGFSVQYNDANHIDHLSSSEIWLWTGSDKETRKFVAIVPNTCIVEFVAPCRTYNPITPSPDLMQAEIALLAKEVRSLKRKIGGAK